MNGEIQELSYHLACYALAVEMRDSGSKRRSYLQEVFSSIEKYFQKKGPWEDLALFIEECHPRCADPQGPIGPFWIAVCMETDREYRAPCEHVEVAKDVLHNLKTHGKMRYISAART